MKSTLKLITLIILFLTHINANATGFGFYTTAANSGDATWDHWNNGSHSDTGIDQKEFGIMLDTAVARDKLYNYRLQIAFSDVSYDGADYDGISLMNTFGFGIVRTQSMRLWIGPQIGFKGLDAKNQPRSISGTEFGMATGLNYHISPKISLTAEAGIRAGISDEGDNNDGTDYFDVDEKRYFINIGILFRINDDF